MNHAERAKSLFEQGYNCAQSVLGAFAEDVGLEPEEAFRLASSFGGGMGGMREVCGTVSGILMAAGLLYGYSDPSDRQGKIEQYERVRELSERFRAEHGSIICRELLGLGEHPQPKAPEERTADYYKKRPCGGLTASAAKILEDYIGEHPVRK